MMRRFIPGRFSSKSHFLLAFRKKSGVSAQKGVLNQGVLNQTDCTNKQPFWIFIFCKSIHHIGIEHLEGAIARFARHFTLQVLYSYLPLIITLTLKGF